MFIKRNAVTAFLMAVLTCLSLESSAQDFKMKFGRIDDDNLKMSSYKNDTSVSAMVIGDFGNVSFNYNQNSGFQLLFKRHKRIKIFKKEGYKYADQMIRLYDGNDVKENVGRIKAVTYNFEGDRVKKSKMKRKAVFREEINDYWNSVKFTLPDVKEGSVIEFEYTVSSDRLFSLPVWYFQESIPVKWSEFIVAAPEYFIYKQVSTGYEALSVNEHSRGTGNITISTTTSGGYSGRGVKRSNVSTDNISFFTNIYRMVGTDIPPFIEEPMLTTKENYINKVNFELASTNWPDKPAESYTQTWESVSRQLMDHDSFGDQMEVGAFLNAPLKTISGTFSDPLKKMLAIYEYIKGHMKWNNYLSIYTTNTLRSAYRQQEGSVADINLMLTLMLQKAGFDAKPVVLSTRSHGIVNKYFPQMSTFNYVVTIVRHDGKFYLLDATEKNCPFGLLPFRCLNGEGRIISREGGNWVALNAAGSYDEECMLKLALSEDGSMKGNLERTTGGYSAFDLRNDIEKEKSHQDYIETLEDDNPGMIIEDYEFTNLDNINSPLTESYEISFMDEAEVAVDMFYLNPAFYERMENNPFKLEDRKYPIDFGAPVHRTYKVVIDIPEGYIVEEVPESQVFNFSEGSSVFNYNIVLKEDQIILENELQINRVLYAYDDYKGLKNFFDNIVKKQSEIVVLKKKVVSK